MCDHGREGAKRFAAPLKRFGPQIVSGSDGAHVVEERNQGGVVPTHVLARHPGEGLPVLEYAAAALLSCYAAAACRRRALLLLLLGLG